MHESVMSFGSVNITSAHVRGMRVCEVGAFDVNGSLRAHVESLGPESYVGTDMRMGPGVDVECPASSLVNVFGASSFDVVISTEALEHCSDWRSDVSSMKRILRPGGFMLITARGPGMFHHGYPHDYWRFTLKDFGCIFSDHELLSLQRDRQAPGVLAFMRKPIDWVECDLSSIEVAALTPENAPGFQG